MHVPAFSIGMRGDKIRAIRSHLSGQLHTRAMHARYTSLVVTAKLLGRKTLRNKKRFVLPLSSSAVNPLQSLAAPGLGSGCTTGRKIRHCSSPWDALFSVFAATIGGIDNRSHSVSRPGYLYNTHCCITANILASMSVAISPIDSCECSRVSSAL